MAGILTRVMGFDPISTNVGVENAVPTNVIKETEYSFFLLLTDEQIQSVLSRYENNPFEIFLEGKLPGNDSLRPRIRQWLDSSGQFKSASLETKVPVGDSKEEYPNDICQMNFRALAMACDSMTSRVRIHIPLAKPDGSPYLKKDGSQMGWELDLFYNPIFDGSINNWVKIELEVDALTVADMDIVNVIPFEYERLINSKSQDPEDRRVISDLYSTGYNIATNRNADYESVPTIRSVGTEDFFSFSIPGNEDFDLKNIAIATILVSLFAALAKWISSKLSGGGGGSSGGGGSPSTSSKSTPPQVVKMKASVTKAKAATPAATAAIPAAKTAAKAIENVAPVVRLRRVIDVGSSIGPLSQRTEEAIAAGMKAKDVNYRVLTRKQIRAIEELSGLYSFKASWGEPGPCTLHLLLDEVNPTESYYSFLDVVTSSNMLNRAISENAHGFQYASFMTRAGVLLKNFDLVNQICDPTTTRTQIGLIKESLATVVDSLPGFMTAVDEACEAETPQLSPELVKRVIELRAYFNEENKPKSSYLFMSKEWRDEPRLAYVTREDAIQSKAELEAFVGIGHTFDQVFDLDKLDKLSDELKSGLELAREVSNNLLDVSEQLKKTLGEAGTVGDPSLRKKLVAVFGREDVSKYFNLRNDLTSWATSISYWVSDMVRISTMTTRICEAIHSGLERTKKGEEWLDKFKDEINSINDDDVKAYEQKRYVVHG